MYKFIIYCCLCCVTLPALSNETASTLELSPSKLWETTPDLLQSSNPKSGLYRHWTYTNNSSELFYSSSLSKSELYFLEMDIPEISFKFTNNQLQTARLTIYNKRDQQPLSSRYFEMITNLVKDKIAIWLDSEDMGTFDIAKIPTGFSKQLTWENDRLSVTIEAQADEEVVHYVQVSITKPAKDKTRRLARLTTPKQMGNHDVLIPNVPIVHQIRSGYCAPATAEILSRYFGADCNMHQIASNLHTSTNSGTSSERITALFGRIAESYNLQSELLYEFKDIKQFTKMVKQYNSYAEKQNMPHIKLAFIEQGETQMCNLADTLANIDFKTYKRFKTRYQQAEMEKFFQTICTSIDAGYPLAWSLINGLDQDNSDHNAVVGHICVISGYNKVTRELIVTDPKGLKGQNKRVSLEDAWASNVGLHIFSPATQ